MSEEVINFDVAHHTKSISGGIICQMTNLGQKLASLQLDLVKKRFPLGVWLVFGLWLVALVATSITDYQFHSFWQNQESWQYLIVRLLGWFWLSVVTVSASEFAISQFELAHQKMLLKNQFAIKLALLVINAIVILSVFPLSYTQFHELSTGEFSSQLLIKVFYFVGYVASVCSLVLLTASVGNLRKSKSMWYLWWSLFSTTVIVSFFSFVIMIGVGIAIGSVQVFFKVSWFRLMQYIFATVVALIAPLKGLSMLPSTEKMAQAEFSLHSLYRFFTQKIVATLVAVYLLLLYSFAFKQLAIHQWPEGGVVYSILGLLIPVVILSILYFPERYFPKTQKNLWDLFLQKAMYVLSIPMVLMYLLSIFVRVGDYGITIPRYLVIMFGLWLLVFNVYFAIAKKQRLAFIPLSMIVFIVIGLYLPAVNMFSVSENSQLARLDTLLKAQNLLGNNGELVSAKLSDQQQSQIDFSIVRYLKQFHYTPTLKKQKPYLATLVTYTPANYYSDRSLSPNASVYVSMTSSSQEDSFLVSNHSRIFTQTIFLSENYPQQKGITLDDGTKVNLKIELLSPKTVKFTINGREQTADLGPVIESARLMQQRNVTNQSYVTVYFQPNSIRQLSVHDQGQTYTLYVTSLETTFLRIPGSAEWGALQQVRSVSAMLAVSEQ